MSEPKQCGCVQSRPSTGSLAGTMTEGVNRSACRYPEAAAAAERLRQCVAAIRAELERVERMQKEFDSDIHPMNFQIYGKVAMAYRFARRALGESTEEAE